jgi:hypothetical protein
MNVSFAAAVLRLHLAAYRDGDGSLSDIDCACEDGCTVSIEAADSRGQWHFASYTLARGEAFDRELIIEWLNGAED